MSISLHNIGPNKGAKKNRKRVGRGDASSGTYSGRGLKGQRSRSGGRSGLALKGLRTIMLAIPKKRGFNSNKPKSAIVQIGDLASTFPTGAKVTPEVLLSKGLIGDTSAGVKILADGDLGVALTVSGCRVSKAAQTKIEQAGGTVV